MAIVNLCYDFLNIDGLVQERHNSSVLELKLYLSCTNPLKRNGVTSFLH